MFFELIKRLRAVSRYDACSSQVDLPVFGSALPKLILYLEIISTPLLFRLHPQHGLLLRLSLGLLPSALIVSAFLVFDNPLVKFTVELRFFYLFHPT